MYRYTTSTACRLPEPFSCLPCVSNVHSSLLIGSNAFIHHAPIPRPAPAPVFAAHPALDPTPSLPAQNKCSWPALPVPRERLDWSIHTKATASSDWPSDYPHTHRKHRRRPRLHILPIICEDENLPSVPRSIQERHITGVGVGNRARTSV
ncbi:hypothetical protein BKA93DRAFT_559575 [Sparassis latifolia]